MEDKGRAKTDNNQLREMTLRIIKTSYDSRVIYRLASHHNERRRDDSVVSEPARSSIYSEGEVIRVLNHHSFSGPAVTSNIKSFSGVIEEGFSIAEPLEGCQFGAFGQPDWSGQSDAYSLNNARSKTISDRRGEKIYSRFPVANWPPCRSLADWLGLRHTNDSRLNRSPDYQQIDVL